MRAAVGAFALLAALVVPSASPCRAQTPADSLMSLVGRGERQLGAGQRDSALATFRAVLTHSRAVGERRSEGAALYGIGRVFLTIGQVDSARGYYQSVLPLTRALGLRNAEAGALQDLAVVYTRLGQPDSALAYDRLALALYRAAGDRGGEASMLTNIGVVFGRIGRPDSALAYYREALALHRAVGNHKNEAETLTTIGGEYFKTGRPDSALVFLRPALALRRAAGDGQGEAETLRVIGAVLEGIGRPDSALACLRAALLLHRAVGDRAGEATALASIGGVFSRTGQPDSALFYYRAALPRVRAVGDRTGEAVTLSHLGWIFTGIGTLDSALTYFRAALPLLRAVGDRRGEALALSRMGVAYHRTGHVDSALTYYRVALPLHRAVGDGGGEAETLGDIGRGFAERGQADSALAYFRAALSLARAVGDPSQQAGTLSAISRIYGSIRRYDAALHVLDSAMALYATIRMHAGGDAGAVAFAEDHHDAADMWVGAWLSRAASRDTSATVAVTAALAAAERGRAQGLRDLLARSGSAAGPTADSTGWAHDTVPDADLATEGTSELDALRRAGSAALYYFISPAALTTWLLSPTGELRVGGRRRLNGDSLAALVTTLRAALGADAARTRMARGGDVEQERVARRSPDDTAGSRGVEDEASPEAQARLRAVMAALAATLLPPGLARTVPAGTDLVIVPHGVLGLVPFGALPIVGDTLPLGARYALRYAPSLRALAAAEAHAVAGAAGRALVVGDPAMPTVTAADGRRVKLRDLPAARAEGDAVARRFGVAVLTDRGATETAVRQALPNAHLVHLATHGLAYGSEARVRDSYVALAPDGKNDGLLTIGELLDAVPPLSADLVVLSACQTGLGDLKRAEGTVGFQRALLAKGARSVLVSLWSVDDRATALLMRQFYAHWLGADGQPARSKAEALRLAQTDVRLTPGFASPRYWAAFQLVGAR